MKKAGKMNLSLRPIVIGAAISLCSYFLILLFIAFSVDRGNNKIQTIPVIYYIAQTICVLIGGIISSIMGKDNKVAHCILSGLITLAVETILCVALFNEITMVIFWQYIAGITGIGIVVYITTRRSTGTNRRAARRFKRFVQSAQ